MAIYALAAQHPVVDPTAWIAPGAHIVGQVTLGPCCSVWFGAVLRGDNAAITLAQGTNVQEGAVLHTDPGAPLTIAARVTIGHQAMLHGCSIGAGSLIGIQAVVLNGAQIGPECLIGAGALIPEGQIIPPRSLVLGTPGRIVRPLTEGELENLRASAERYIERAAQFSSQLTLLEP